MAPAIERISAVTFRVANMAESVRFYREVLGMELLYGGEDAGFSSPSRKMRSLAGSVRNLPALNRSWRIVSCISLPSGQNWRLLSDVT